MEIYRGLCDETRMRILRLLSKGPLCVCHFQTVLQASQVAISKHLAYLRARGMVEVARHEQWKIYRLPENGPAELGLQMRCLQDCVQSSAIFQQDLKRLKAIQDECGWVEAVAGKRGRRARFC
ncbi:MAG: winged helix-turn-helix transcriptional regulator [Verrucomicrobia bacterium]|nr:winged helix-turn-helix transcriptional regulator [Verrucomicrobiota bacterium]